MHTRARAHTHTHKPNEKHPWHFTSSIHLGAHRYERNEPTPHKHTRTSTPIIITMALPTTSAYDDEFGEAIEHILNCSLNASLPEDATRTAEDFARAAYCGYTYNDELFWEEGVRYHGHCMCACALRRPLPLHARTHVRMHAQVPYSYKTEEVYCPDSDTYHILDCNGTAGLQSYTCPVSEVAAACRYWDKVNMSWSSEGCTLWKSDRANGVAYCNCTHLTDYAAQELATLSANTAVFTSVTSSSRDRH